LGDNYIRTPLIKQFESDETYIATIFHELAHWADYNILGTKFTADKKSVENAYTELVAELSACFLSAERVTFRIFTYNLFSPYQSLQQGQIYQKES
jgi:antirestriction protein ArdC